MGDKWTTSGGWRLKAKQHRGFDGRAMHRNRAPRPAIVIDSINDYQKKDLQNNSPLYPRNARGSYPAYADPSLRRAIYSDRNAQPNGDNAPDHRVHHSRLQNAIRQKIREPDHDFSLTAQHTHSIPHFSHQSEIIHPMIGQQQQNLYAKSLPFHGPSVTPSLSGAERYPPQQYFVPSIQYSFEPDPTLPKYDAMDLYQRSQNTNFSQNNTGIGILESQTNGLARFQKHPTSSQAYGKQRGGVFLSQRYTEKFLGEQLREVSSIGTPYENFADPLQFNETKSRFAFRDELSALNRETNAMYPNANGKRLFVENYFQYNVDNVGGPLQARDSNSSFSPSMECIGDELYDFNTDHYTLHPNTNSKRLFGQKYFQNKVEEGQMTTSNPFQIRSPPKLSSSILQEPPFDWIYPDFDPHTGHDLLFTYCHDGKDSTSGIERFKKKRIPATGKRFDFVFAQDNVVPSKNAPDDFEISFQKIDSKNSQKKFEVNPPVREEVHKKQFEEKCPVPADAHRMEVPEPLRRRCEAMPIKIGDDIPRECLQGSPENKKTPIFQKHIRFFNEGVEVDLNNVPLARPNSIDSRVSSMGSLSSSQRLQMESDDDFNLGGKTSMWGDSKVN